MDPLIAPKIMKGYIGFNPSVNYTTPEGKRFIGSYTTQENTLPNDKKGGCSNITDDEGNFLYRNGNPGPTDLLCGGFNFSKFSGKNIDSYVAYTYDATYAMARAMHNVLYVQKQAITGKLLYSALINNVKFIGPTGLVSFAKVKIT
jgi:hypothetical protein